MYSNQATPTRDRVLRAVMRRGPVSAAGLADELGLVPAGLRRHLDALEAEGLVTVHHGRNPKGQGAGRPARTYVVTPKGHGSQGNDEYQRLTRLALETLKEQGGQEAVTGFARRRAREITELFHAHPAAAPAGQLSADERAAILGEVLGAKGYEPTLSEVRASGRPSLQLCQSHCPIRELAGDYPEFCAAETEALRELLGPEAVRLSTMASGSHVCTMRVPLPAPPHPSAPGAPDGGTEHASPTTRKAA